MVLGFRLVGAGEITQIEEGWFAESHVKQLVQTRNYSNIFKLEIVVGFPLLQVLF